MKKIIAFAGSNSKESINKKLVTYTASLIDNVDSTVLDLNEFDLPLYAIDLEKEHGIPKHAHNFLELIKASDGIILSLAEHNGAYSVAFKNIFDWMSRIDGKLWSNKSMLLMATSPGRRGGASVLNMAKNRFPYMGGNIVAEFSLPNFTDNFKEGKVVESDLSVELKNKVEDFKKSL